MNNHHIYVYVCICNAFHDILWLFLWIHCNVFRYINNCDCREEIQRIKASNPDISHREAFSTAAKNVSLSFITIFLFHFCICIPVYECMQVLYRFFPLTCDDCTIKNEFVVYINMVKIEIQCPLNYCRNISKKANASFLFQAFPLYQTWL